MGQCVAMRVLAALLFLASPAHADERIGSFVLPDDEPTVIRLDGEITARTVLEFRLLKQQRPDLKTLHLHSPGGIQGAGYDIAMDVRRFKMATYVPADSACASACVYILLAGAPRKADGGVAVHQTTHHPDNLPFVEEGERWVAAAFAELNAPQGLIDARNRTPADGAYWFTDDELRAFGLR